MTHTASARRQFPWRSSKLSSRSGEDVRPINWANRPKSYLSRTEVRRGGKESDFRLECA
jgi:hypothetical protein